MKLGRKVALRQRVIATATVFFKRFYLKNAYAETDPFLVIAACCYVAAKAEECPVSIKLVASEARALFSRTCHFYLTIYMLTVQQKTTTMSNPLYSTKTG